MEALVYPESAESFLKSTWQKEPRVFKGTSDRSERFGNLFGTDHFDTVLKTPGDQTLEFGIDIFTARYVDGIRERPLADACNAANIWKLFREGCTLQFLHPQRFIPELRDICVSLESQFGCLVGCNAYLTPKLTQGLAPHHDDVELFICQTQGSKKWKLYRPLNGFILPNGPSGDLEQKSIGVPIMEVTLQVGDVLYMPKGIIHQALAQEQDSVHLTISTYQRWTWGDLLSTVMDETILASGEPVCLPCPMREGLPLSLLMQAGKYTGDRLTSQSAAQQLAQRLRDLADSVEKNVEIVQKATDVMAYGFVTRRMAPGDACLPDQDQYPMLEDTIKVTGRGFSRLLPVLSDDGCPENDKIQVVSCLLNNPRMHMMQNGNSFDVMENETGIKEVSDTSQGNEDELSVLFDISRKEALMQIFNVAGNGVKVRDLLLPTEGERLELSGSLWEQGIVQVESDCEQN